MVVFPDQGPVSTPQTELSGTDRQTGWKASEMESPKLGRLNVSWGEL